MSISKRAFGVEGFLSAKQAFPTRDELSSWIPKTVSYGPMKAAFHELKLENKTLSVTYKLGNERLVKKTIPYNPIDDAINKQEVLTRLVIEAFE